MTAQMTTVADGFNFLEAPRWRDGRLWFSDFYGYKVRSMHEDGSDIRVEAEVPGQPSGLGWLPDGRLVIVSMRDRKILRREPDGTLSVHGDLGSYATGHVNDMAVDAQGRVYAGNFGFDLMAGDPVEPAALPRVDPDGQVTEVADDLWFPNGSAITADNVLQVAGDGACLDAEGALWIADAIGGRLIRVLEGGTITDEIDPGSPVYACALGGAAGTTLFACAAPDFHEGPRKAAREARMLATQVAVPGA
jgi:sugar lactone lactonase YvrE